MGEDLSSIQVNTNDVIRFDVVKIDDNKESIIKSKAHIPYSN